MEKSFDFVNCVGFPSTNSPVTINCLHNVQAFTCATSESSCFHSFANQVRNSPCLVPVQLGGQEFAQACTGGAVFGYRVTD